MRKILNSFFVRFLVVLITLQGAVAAQLLTLQPAHASDGDSTPQVVINEVMWMGTYIGSTGYSSDEWIELYNTVATPSEALTLSVGGVPISVPEGAIPGFGYYVIANSPSVSALIAPDQVIETGSSWISNNCVTANISAADDYGRIDSVTCDGTDYLAGLNDTTNHIRRSMERTVDLATWQTSIGFNANFIPEAYGSSFATPGSANTAPIAYPLDCTVDAVKDGSDVVVDWTDCFSPDLNSAIAGYDLKINTGDATDEWQTLDGLETSVIMGGEYIPFNTPVSFSVRAFDGNGNRSEMVTSSEVTRTTPLAPTDVSVVNSPSIISGEVEATLTWDETDPVTDFVVSYRPAGSTDIPVTVDVSGLKTVTITGLQASIQYEYSVQARNGDELSEPSDLVLDQVPVLVEANVQRNQNTPGIVDSIQGLVGAVSEQSIIRVYETELLTTQIGVAISEADGSFDPISIGDNTNAHVWVQPTSIVTGKTGKAYELKNDVVAPNAPTLTKLVSKCQTDESCRVELHWIDNGPDTAKYQVGYAVDGVETRTIDITSTSVQTDLKTGRSYKFVVYAYDAAGNESVASNAFEVTLVKGIKTNVDLIDGTPVVTTTELEGAGVSVNASTSSSPLSFVSQAQAADDQPTDDVAPTETKTEAAKQDWVRIFVVVILLLVVAGGFYALSRTFKEGDGLDNVVPEKKKPVVVAGKTKKPGSKTKRKTNKKK